MIQRFTRVTTVASLATLLATAAGATTWTVDDSGGADFTAIQPAITAAADGDVILVLPGSYAAFSIVGKGVVVRGSGAETVTVTGATMVSQLSSTQAVEIAGMTFVRPNAQVPPPPFQAQSNQGVLTLRACTFQGANGIQSGGGSAARLTECALSIVHASTFVGGTGSGGGITTGRGGLGLNVTFGDLVLLHSTVSGGLGGTDADFDEDGGDGGVGLSLGFGDVRVAHSTIRGGNGGNGGIDKGVCMAAGAGANAVTLFQNSFATNDVILVPGARGSFVCGVSQPPPTGFEIVGGVAAPLDFTPYCFGFEALCPCGNRGFGLGGCEISFATGGGRLEASGTPSVAGDTLTLAAQGLPPAGTAILFQGTSAVGANSTGAIFGDGLRCAGGAVTRLASRTVVAGGATFGSAAGDPPLSVTGAIPSSAGVFFYQAWFRNAAAFCTASTFNLTHAVEIRWAP